MAEQGIEQPELEDEVEDMQDEEVVDAVGSLPINQMALTLGRLRDRLKHATGGAVVKMDAVLDDDYTYHHAQIRLCSGNADREVQFLTHFRLPAADMKNGELFCIFGPGAAGRALRLTGSQVGELFHRRWHRPVNVIRNAYSICADTTPNLKRAESVSCEFCAACYCKKASHGPSKTTTTPSSLAPCNSPGTLHIDLKGMMTRSVHGYQYALFAVEECSRFVFIEFLKSKETREQIAAVARIIERFNSMVNVGSDANGKPLSKPSVTVIRSDHEGALESSLFESFRADVGIHSEMSPPHDHDLNPIAESAIGVISDLACCIRGHSGAPRGLWPARIHQHGSEQLSQR